MPVKWCCPVFQGHYENAGERMFSVLIDRDSLGRGAFILQHRALNPDVQLPPDLQVPVSIVSELQVRFCPWCGRDLDRWYKNWIDELCRPGFRVPLEDPHL